jgi:hypothetical protein
MNGPCSFEIIARKSMVITWRSVEVGSCCEAVGAESGNNVAVIGYRWACFRP